MYGKPKVLVRKYQMLYMMSWHQDQDIITPETITMLK